MSARSNIARQFASERKGAWPALQITRTNCQSQRETVRYAHSNRDRCFTIARAKIYFKKIKKNKRESRQCLLSLAE